MKRFLLYGAAALLAVLTLSREKGDVGELIPVELVSVYRAEDQICLETDTRDRGAGKDLEAALGDLEASAQGKIFLETADYLLITKEVYPLLPQLREILRPSAEICLNQGGDAQAAAFLAAHKPGVTLNDTRKGWARLPVLTRTEERYHLAGQ